MAPIFQKISERLNIIDWKYERLHLADTEHLLTWNKSFLESYFCSVLFIYLFIYLSIYLFVYSTIFLQYDNTQKVKKKKKIKTQVQYVQYNSPIKEPAEDWCVFSSGTFS